MGSNYKDAADELTAILICLGAEVTVFTLTIIIAIKHNKINLQLKPKSKGRKNNLGSCFSCKDVR